MEITHRKKTLEWKQLKLFIHALIIYTKLLATIIKNVIKKSWVDRQGLSKPLCNCRVREECPAGCKWNSENVVSKETIFAMENRNDIKIHFGISVGNWKQRLYSQRHYFSNLSLSNETALSKWFWRLKDSGLTPLVRWNFIKRSTTPSNLSRFNLCLEEKISSI